MDQKPFMVFDLLKMDESLVAELKKLSKGSFDLEMTLSTASELKYVREMKKYLGQQLEDPSEEFIRLLAKQVYSGHLTQKARDQFSGAVKKAFNEFVVERLRDDFESFVTGKRGSEQEGQPADAEADVQQGKGVVTTEDEKLGFYIVRAIMSKVVDPSRVVMRDTKSYCGILLDDNNRKPICRLRFDYATKNCLGLFKDDKTEEVVEIKSIEDIYQYADQLRAMVKAYE